MPAHLYSLIRKAYGILGTATPIPADCGSLCGALCCEGDDDVGMLLFPGEAARLARAPGFRVHRITYMDTKQWLLTCNGPCERSKRPLSCRVFPLGPRVEGTHATARLDPRGKLLKCPLAIMAYLDQEFVRKVNEVFRLLEKDGRMLAFLQTISGELDELERFV